MSEIEEWEIGGPFGTNIFKKGTLTQVALVGNIHQQGNENYDRWAELIVSAPKQQATIDALRDLLRQWCAAVECCGQISKGWNVYKESKAALALAKGGSPK